MEIQKHQTVIPPAAFLLAKTRRSSYDVAQAIAEQEHTIWARAVFGPYQVAAYVEAEDATALVAFIETLRQSQDIWDLDARICKVIPGDEELASCQITKAETAVLLINVDYKIELERVVTINLRKLHGMAVARAMWGPADIIAIVEADDRKAMRDLICDEVKVMKGVLSNSTLYCYP
jgi:uncharacterized protein with GYD domain